MKKTMILCLILLIIASYIPVYSFGIGDLPGTSTTKEKGIEDFGQNVIKVISTVASISSVVVLIIIGIRYMMGSVEEKAEYKKSMLPYVIGCILVFGASRIASILYNVAFNL